MKLSDPTPASEIKTRQGPGGRMLSYIDARFVMDRLDAAVGSDGWQDKFEDRADGSVRCGIGIWVDDLKQWVWKWDVGDPSDIEATKGVHSDAFKRAGVKWGIGRDLYGDHPTQRPAEAPRKPVAPRQTQPAPDSTLEPEAYPWDGMGTLPEKEIFSDLIVDEANCPFHLKAWRHNSRGYYCATKEADGKWCQRQPSKAWVASQELTPA